MKFYFCEGCGKRLTEHDINEGEARDKKLRGVYCDKCAIGIMTLDTVPMDEEEARKVLGQAGTQRAVRPSGGAASARPAPSQQRRAIRSSGLKTPAAERRVPATHSAPGARVAAPPREANYLPYILGAVVLGGFLLFFAFGDPAPTRKKTKRAEKDSPAAIAATTPVKATNPGNAKAPVSKPGPAAAPVSNPTSSPPTKRELTPKELYEKRLKEGKVKPHTPAPAPAPPPGPNDLEHGPWKDLFDGKTLDQWKISKGRAEVRDGTLFIDGTAGKSKEARIDSRRIFKDYEFVGSYQFESEGYFDFRWHSRDKLVDLRRKDRRWNVFRVVVQGNTATVEINGQPVKAKKNEGQNTEGYLSFYANNGARVRLKDLRVRSLAAAPAPAASGIGEAGDWTDLFDGRSKTGWKVTHGSWNVVDGELVGKSAGGRRVRIESVKHYGDYELTCDINTTTRFAEIQIRNYARVLLTTNTRGQWKKVRIVARGADVQSTVDGQPMADGEPPRAAPLSGYIAFYVKRGIMKVKNIRLRERKP